MSNDKEPDKPYGPTDAALGTGAPDDPALTDDLNSYMEDGTAAYSEEHIKSLPWQEQLRLRPGMYVGKLGDGTASDDGIYIMLKEVMDNSIDEHTMGFGKNIDIDINDEGVRVRDYGRGIPLGKLYDAVATMNTSGKYDGDAFVKSVGMNGVGLKAVNALSSSFIVSSVRDGHKKTLHFSEGLQTQPDVEEPTDEPDGTIVTFVPDRKLFHEYSYRDEFVQPMLKKYTFLNTALTITCNGQKYHSRKGLEDLLEDSLTKDKLYPIIHLKDKDIEIALTHTNQYGEEYYTFVNGQHTTQGGTHLSAFKEAVARTIKEYYGKAFENSDVRSGMVAALAIKVQEPVFESQTKIKLGSGAMKPGGVTVAKFVGDFLKHELDNYLHREQETSEIMLKKIQQNEKERKAMAGVTKAARERAKKINIRNKSLLDSTIHFSDAKGDPELKEATSIFIVEGDSAGGSITKVRDVRTQAVFLLSGKPLNTYGLTKRIVYENEKFNTLQAALNIEESIDDLRYNNVIIATDADVDGMHIRLLMITFFLQFFPDLIKQGHLYVLQTPLFRVRAMKASRKKGQPEAETYYCYNDEERIAAIEKIGAKKAEITRFKGLGEISADEFRLFIGPQMRVDRVNLRRDDGAAEIMDFYMGKNTRERQNFIIDNLVVEDDSQIS